MVSQRTVHTCFFYYLDFVAVGWMHSDIPEPFIRLTTNFCVLSWYVSNGWMVGDERHTNFFTTHRDLLILAWNLF